MNLIRLRGTQTMSLGFASHLEDPDLDRVSAALVRRRAGEHPGVPGVNYVGGRYLIVAGQ
jgi:hypothetical protein